jgi:iron(II)-dependent oxidoreductase
MGDLREDIAAWLAHTRARTLGLYAPLDQGDLQQANGDCLGPMIWDLGHIAAFEELWIVHKAGGEPLEKPERLGLYDPFEVPRSERDERPLPSLSATLTYLERVRRRSLGVLDRLIPGTDDPLLKDGFVFRMVVQHEWQHQEIALQGLDLRCEDEPYPPAAALSGGTGEPPAGVDDTETVLIPGGPTTIGSDEGTRTYDNERPAHRVDLPAFRVDRYPVTCRRWVAFIEDGGYERAEHWSEPGRQWLAESDARAPQGWWRDRNGTWWVTRFGHRLPVDPSEPVQHVCAHEADAFANWAGARLPTELEWEKAAAGSRSPDRPPVYPWGDAWPTRERANLFGDRWGPVPAGSRPEGASSDGVEQLLGDVYEWTSSRFDGYPGFEPFPYPEYSQAFFGEQYRVLRGASWTSGPWMARRTYRNWDFPVRRQIFAGLRLAWDAD